jgi:hypothetical protein
MRGIDEFGVDQGFNYGFVTSYSGNTFVMDSVFAGGSGTYTNWTLFMLGAQGIQGDQGATGAGATGATGAIANPLSTIFTITNTTISSSTTTGALQVAGGVGIGGNIYASGHIVPGADLTYDLGTSSTQWRSLYVGTSTIFIGGKALSVTPTGAITVDGSQSSQGPTFHAYRSSAQSFTNGQWTKFQGNFELFDTNSSYDNATNYRFQPTVAGYYQIYVQVTPNYASGTTGYSGIYKSGSLYKATYFFQPSGNYISASTSALVYLNGSTDYVEAYFYFASATALFADATANYFEGYLVRGV